MAAVPEAEIAPVAFAGLIPPEAEDALPVIVVPAAAILVAFNIVFAVTEGTVTVAVPPAFNVTV